MVAGVSQLPQLQVRVSPQMIAFAGVLAMSQPELEARVERELTDNPALEQADTVRCLTCGMPMAGSCSRCGPPASFTAGVSSTPPEVAGWPTPRQQLVAESALLVPAADRWLVEYVVADLDACGLLGCSSEDLALRLQVDAERVRRVVRALREVGPVSLAARDVPEALLLQLEPWERSGTAPPVTRAVLKHHLADLAGGRLGDIALALSVSVDEVAAVLAFVRNQLQPPSLPDPPPSYPPPPCPDVVIDRVQGTAEFDVRVIEPTAVRLQIASSYRVVAEAGSATGRLTAEQRATARHQIDRAADFLDHLEQRTSTLLRVARMVVDRQHEFLCRGAVAHCRLTRSEVASSLGVHESTVSRAVRGKLVRLPWGEVMAFSALFGGAVDIRECLRQLISHESEPLSDGALALALAAQGHVVARRTVAKYRSQLGIPAQDARRR